MAGGVSEPLYDVLVAEAAEALAVPVAFISFVDGEEERVAAIRGWQVAAIDAERAFAPRMRGERDVVVIPDTTADARFASHPLVTGIPNIRFYAAAPIFNGHGDFAGALSILDRKPRTLGSEQVTLLRVLGRQVSRELAAKERVAEANDRFREFFEQTDDLVMSISADGRLLHANEAVMETLGFSREELSRTPLLQVVDPDSRDDFRDAFADTFATGEPQRVETVFVTASGRRITVDGSLHPKMLDGQAVLARVIFRDVSDRKQFESELGNARDAALEAARLKTQFLTNVSHEIRTPMNGIIGMTSLALSTELTREQRDYLALVKGSADSLLTVINDILDFSKIEAGKLELERVDFGLGQALGDTLSTLALRAHQK
ncbi:MAG TPA: histidine kinase dimerization/phospho-acceptor domain-containing protein, partial [Thermoanaerobaculia bacterium]